MLVSLYHRLLSSALRIFFKLLYHQFSWSYNLVAVVVSGGRWKNWVLSVLPYLNGPRVLELGHGPGHLLKAMREKGLKVTGLDESRWMGFLAFWGLLKSGYGFLLVNGYAQSLPFPNCFFDQIVSTFPSEYILDPMTLSEAHRVLVPGGELIILPSAWITGKGLYDRLAAWLFQVAGQATEWDNQFSEPIKKAGFELSLEIKERQSDRLLIVKGKKPENFI